MIHHQAFHPPKDRRKPVKWWAVQTPSLAVVRCTIDAGQLHLGHVPRPVPVAVHLTGDPPPDNGPVDKAALAAELDHLNRERQTIELAAVAEAESEAMAALGIEEKGAVVVTAAPDGEPCALLGSDMRSDGGGRTPGRTESASPWACPSPWYGSWPMRTTFTRSKGVSARAA